jgi:hypothetical protein
MYLLEDTLVVAECMKLDRYTTLLRNSKTTHWRGIFQPQWKRIQLHRIKLVFYQRDNSKRHYCGGYGLAQNYLCTLIFMLVPSHIGGYTLYIVPLPSYRGGYIGTKCTV